MTYDQAFFDTYTERRGTRSIKWDGCNEKFGVDPSVEMLPMWIADMDCMADYLKKNLPQPMNNLKQPIVTIWK